MQILEVVDRLRGGDEIVVQRTAAGSLAITGVVSSDAQKRKVFDGIAMIRAGTSVVVDVKTNREAEAEERPRDSPVSRRIEVRTQPPGRPPIVSFLIDRGASSVDAAVVARTLATRVLPTSGRVRRHAAVLHSVLVRFSTEAVASFEGPGRAAWERLMLRHATECLEALELLDRALAPYFADSADQTPTALQDLDATIRQLAHEAATIDDLVRGALTTSDGTTVPSNGSVALDLRVHIANARRDARMIARLFQR
jgi:hypothetical protein